MADSVISDTEESTVGANESSSSTILIHDDSLYETPKDQFENVLYKTTQEDSKTTLTFVSHAFFIDLRDKLNSDFASSMSTSNGDTVSKCVTHVSGMRCEIVINSADRTVCATGEGHRVWREWRFTQMAKSLFKRFVENADQNRNVASENECQQTNTDSTTMGNVANNMVYRKRCLVARSPAILRHSHCTQAPRSHRGTM